MADFAIDEAAYRRQLSKAKESLTRCLFSRYALSPVCDDETIIRAALEEVPRIWTQFRNNPRYQKIITLFINQHTDARLVLLNPVERRRNRENNCGIT